jgi:hypothetical protein
MSGTGECNWQGVSSIGVTRDDARLADSFVEDELDELPDRGYRKNVTSDLSVAARVSERECNDMDVADPALDLGSKNGRGVKLLDGAVRELLDVVESARVRGEGGSITEPCEYWRGTQYGRSTTGGDAERRVDAARGYGVGALVFR